MPWVLWRWIGGFTLPLLVGIESRDQDESLSLNAAVHRVGQRVGVNPDTLRGWCRRVEIDTGRRAGHYDG